MNYFAKVTSSYTPKNKLHEAVLEVFHEEDRKIVLSNESFLESLRNKIDALNQRYRRCKPVKVEMWDHGRYREGGADMYFFSASELVSITLYVVRNPIAALPEKPKPARIKFNPFQLNLFWDK